jgi:aspartyl-tRNA(Asn)/glutamyl-tRNA(Gln) amidotransferase subunit C
MAKISTQDVLRLARLAKLELTEEELHQFSNEMSVIVEYIDHLQGANVHGLEPTAQVTGLINVMRKDELINYGTTPDDLLKNAPAQEKHQIKVKRVL